MSKSEIEEILDFHLRALGIAHERQFVIPGRKFAYDFFIEPDIVIEVQGGTWSEKRTGHSTGSGIRRDCEKLNHATANGYRQLSFTTDMVGSGEALIVIEKTIARGKGESQ